jgi:hypothetical protein
VSITLLQASSDLVTVPVQARHLVVGDVVDESGQPYVVTSVTHSARVTAYTLDTGDKRARSSLTIVRVVTS